MPLPYTQNWRRGFGGQTGREMAPMTTTTTIILMMIKINKHSALVWPGKFIPPTIAIFSRKEARKKIKELGIGKHTFDELRKRTREDALNIKERNVNCSWYKFLLILLRSVKYIYLTGRMATNCFLSSMTTASDKMPLKDFTTIVRIFCDINFWNLWFWKGIF